MKITLRKLSTPFDKMYFRIATIHKWHYLPGNILITIYSFAPIAIGLPLFILSGNKIHITGSASGTGPCMAERFIKEKTLNE